MYANQIKHDESRRTSKASASIWRQYSLSPVVNEPRDLDRTSYAKVTDLSRTVKTTLQRNTVAHPTSSIRGPHYKAPKRSIENAITNATHTRHARHKGHAPKIG